MTARRPGDGKAVASVNPASDRAGVSAGWIDALVLTLPFLAAACVAWPTLRLPMLTDDRVWAVGSLHHLGDWAPFGTPLPAERVTWSTLMTVLGPDATPHRIAFALAWGLLGAAWAAVLRQAGVGARIAATLGALLVTHHSLAWTYGWLSCWAYVLGGLGVALAMSGALAVTHRESGHLRLCAGVVLACVAKEPFALACGVPLLIVATAPAVEPTARRAALVWGAAPIALWGLAIAVFRERGAWVMPALHMDRLTELHALSTSLTYGLGPAPWSLITIAAAAGAWSLRGRARVWAMLAVCGAIAHAVSMAAAVDHLPGTEQWSLLVVGGEVDPHSRYALVAILWSVFVFGMVAQALQRRAPRAGAWIAPVLLAAVVWDVAGYTRNVSSAFAEPVRAEAGVTGWADAALERLSATPDPQVTLPDGLGGMSPVDVTRVLRLRAVQRRMTLPEFTIEQDPASGTLRLHR